MIDEVLSGLAGAIAAHFMQKWQKPITPDRDGWFALKSGLSSWICLALCAALTVLFGYIYFFVGSSRDDADRQMIALLCLLTGFSLATIWLALTTFGKSIRWRNGLIEVRPIMGKQSTRPKSEIIKVSNNVWLDYHCFTFSDGYKLRFSGHLRGVRQLLRHVRERP